MIEFYKVNIS